MGTKLDRFQAQVLMHLHGGYSRIHIDLANGVVVEIPTEMLPPELRYIGKRITVVMDGPRIVECEPGESK